MTAADATNQRPPDELKHSFDLLSLIQADTPLKKTAGTRGGEFAGPCPFCGGKDRFRVWPNADSPGFWCRQCEAHGDVFSYLMKREGLAFGEAVEWVSEHVGGGSGFISRKRDDTARESTGDSEPPSSAWQHEALAVVEFSESYLWSGRSNANKVLNYLRKKRGLSDETIRARRLGYNPTWLRTRYLNEEGKQVSLAPGITIPRFADDVLWMVNVRRRVGDLSDWLDIMPDRDRNGSEPKKYTCLAGSKPKTLYNADGIKPDRDVLIVEGEFDAMLAQQLLGERVAVVTLGSASNQLPRRWRDKLAESGKVYAALDNDGAGQGAAAKLADQLGQRLITLKLPIGNDTTEYVIEHGGDLVTWFAEATRPAGEPTAATVGMERALNQYGATGETMVYRAICALRLHGIIPMSNEPTPVTSDQLMHGAALAGMSPSEQTFKRYVDRAKSIMHPRISQEKIGCSFEIRPLEDIKTTLRRAAAVDLRVKTFQTVPQPRIDAVTGEAYSLPPAVADLSPQALEDGGLSPEEALEAADLLADQPLDEATQRRRKNATVRLRRMYEAFSQSLDDDRVIALPDDMPVTNERDLKRAQARAWHGAGLPNFQTVSEQMRALGVTSKHTLFAMLKDAGIDKQEDIEPIALKAGDVGQQVREAVRDMKAWPKTYCVISENGEIERHIYDRAGVEAAHRAGERVFIEYQRSNTYTVGDLPTPVEKEAARSVQKPFVKPEEKPAVDEDERIEQTPPGKYPMWWVRGQLALRYELKFKQRPSGTATVRQLVEAIAGRELSAPDELLALGEQWGAVIRRVS
jgi:DNA primase